MVKLKMFISEVKEIQMSNASCAQLILPKQDKRINSSDKIEFAQKSKLKLFYVKGNFSDDYIQEIALFESLSNFLREAKDLSRYSGLNKMFLYSYSSVLDTVYNEFSHDGNILDCKNMTTILQYLRIIFEKLKGNFDIM